MKIQKTTSTVLLLATVGMNCATAGNWLLIDNFQQFHGGQIFTEATEIGWHASSWDGTDEYWMFTDPEDVENIAMYVEPGSYGVGTGNVWAQKALPDGGIAPGETGTLFFRSYWDGLNFSWHVGTADKELEFDDLTGLQTAPGAWADFNALIRLGEAQNLEHRDGGGYVSTNPPQVIEAFTWYSFWLVVENTWDMGTTPPTSTGVYALYVQGPGFGNGEIQTLIPVGTDPPKNKASFRRAPVDADGNPQAIIWAQFATNNYLGIGNFDPVLLDDFYFSSGENLGYPGLNNEPEQLAAPTNIKATILSESEIQLTWKNNASGETGHRIFAEWGDGTWLEVADVAGEDASSYLVVNPDSGQPARFRIQAYSEDMQSRYSIITPASWGNPIFENAHLESSDWWELDWFGRYIELGKEWIYHDELGLLYLSGENAGNFHVYSSLLNTWFWTSRDLFPYFYKYGAYEGWYYYYTGSNNEERWFARLSDGTFIRAPHINQAVPQPSAPSNLKAEIFSSGSVYLTWEDNADREVGYRIFVQRGEEDAWSEVTAVKSKDLTYYIVNGIDTSTPLRFKVQAYKIGSDSGFSNIALAEQSDVFKDTWILMDDFQQHSHGKIYTEATDIGWHASCPDGSDEYWFLSDPYDDENIALFVESGRYGLPKYGELWVQKELPIGGIAPGDTGTLFFRSFWSGTDNTWCIGTADKELKFNPVTGKQTAPGAWADFNALIRLGNAQNLEHRDGEEYVATNPPQVLDVYIWYSFWLVVENTWDMSTIPATSTGVYTLYVQGPGFGDGMSPTLIPVGTNPPKDKASFRRAPVDADGNPQAIIWAQFFTYAGISCSSCGDPFLLDDFYFSLGENLTSPTIIY